MNSIKTLKNVILFCYKWGRKFKYLTYYQRVWLDSINFAKDRLFELAELL